MQGRQKTLVCFPLSPSLVTFPLRNWLPGNHWQYPLMLPLAPLVLLGCPTWSPCFFGQHADGLHHWCFVQLSFYSVPFCFVLTYRWMTRCIQQVAAVLPSPSSTTFFSAFITALSKQVTVSGALVVHAVTHVFLAPEHFILSSSQLFHPFACSCLYFYSKMLHVFSKINQCNYMWFPMSGSAESPI